MATMHERNASGAGIPTTFAQLLKRLRQSAALSQEELAERVRLTAQTIRRAFRNSGETFPAVGEDALGRADERSAVGLAASWVRAAARLRA
jgi:transcriptional regulator with XRE-family HTH domain